MPGTESTYLEILESTVEALHREELSEYWEGEFHESEWGGRHRLVQDWALLYAVLYELTGKEEYLDLGKRYLLDFGRGDHFAAIHCGTAYEILHEELTEEERDEFAADWVAGAESGLERYVGDPSDVAEWDHVTNHVIGACLYADYARYLFPGESEQYEYDQYTDAAWNVWWDRREFHEQASNYEGFAQAFLIHWADIRGRKGEFYGTPSVQNMFERGLKLVTPGGLVAPYGDTGYHQHLCNWIALFERLASDLNDGRFADAAADVRSYLRRVVLDDAFENVTALPATEEIYNGRLIFKNHLHELAWLGLAARWHDPTVDRVPRPEPDGRIRRLPYGHVLTDSDMRQLSAENLVDGQVALTGGTPGSETHTYLLLSVGPELVHDHADAGAIQLLSQDETVLLGTSGYLQRELLYHNVFYAQPSEWTRYPEDAHERIISGDEDCRGRIDALLIEEDASRCRVTFDRYHGLPIDLTREIIVAADGDVSLVDRVVAHEDGYCGGPLFHGETVERRSDGAYRLRQNILRSFGGIESENPPGHVDVEFDSAPVDVVHPELPPIYEESYQSFPTTHYKEVWERSYTPRNCLAVRRDLEPGESVFVTKLRPTVTSST